MLIQQTSLLLSLIASIKHCSTCSDSVLRKLVTLISQQALLQAEGEAARKQAESATKAAQAMLEEASKEASKSKEDADNLVRGLSLHCCVCVGGGVTTVAIPVKIQFQ